MPINPTDPRLEQMKQALLGGQRTLTGLQGAQAPSTNSTNAAVMQTNNPAQSGDSGVQAFNGAIQGLLQQYQQMGTKPFQTQALDAQQEQNNRVLQQTPSSMIGATPGQQNSVRSASAQAVDPIIQGAHSSAQTYGEQLNSYGNILNNAISFSKNHEATLQQAKDDARSIVHDAVSAGSEAVQALIQAQPDILKTAGYNADTLQGIVASLKRQEAQTAYKTYDTGAGSKPPTQAQQTQANYASRLTQAAAIIDDLTAGVSKDNPVAFGAVGKLPSFLQSGDRQQYEQAKRNFVNAILRQESGAAISPTEFASAEAQYFPMPGDSEQTIANKKANRDLVIRNFINASGHAYEAPPSLPKVTSGTTSSGLRYTVSQ